MMTLEEENERPQDYALSTSHSDLHKRFTTALFDLMERSFLGKINSSACVSMHAAQEHIQVITSLMKDYFYIQ